MLPSGGSHEQPKHDAGAAKSTAEAATGDEKDEPASEYARLERLVVTWLVGDEALLTYAALTKKGRGKTYATHLEMLTWPLCMSFMLLYFFGTLDSSAVGRRALFVWVFFWFYQSVFVTLLVWSEGVWKIHELFGYFAFHVFLGAAYGWLIHVLRSELRARGSLDAVTTRITGRLSEVMGLQTAVGVVALTQGIGPKANSRLYATAMFQLSLCMAWLFSIAIFDVSGINPQLALTKLRLGLVEGAALFFTGVLVISGFAAYVLSEQSRPNHDAVEAVWAFFAISTIGGFFCIGRVVWVARRRRRSEVCDSDPEPPA